ncbi:uncharacterized protein DFL_005658 [Arthrobotrys flagrans]|uniref:VPS9 domain-containing protein n=1 Tax=Arthrobotrys flagrans TaxID=97331 RepID=A0A436ZYX5_ARTFL|nr:hypothetical protein DFL_005658 [Arthrobotrys flagrans]
MQEETALRAEQPQPRSLAAAATATFDDDNGKDDLGAISVMTDAKEWEESSTDPVAMPPSGLSVDPTDSSDVSTSLSKLDISPKSPTNTKIKESLSQTLPSSPPAPAPPPKDKPLPTPEDVLSKAETAQSQTPTKPSGNAALPALPRPENGRLHPGYSQKSHGRSLSGSSILDAAEEEEGQDAKGEIRSIMSQFSPKLPPQSDPEVSKLSPSPSPTTNNDEISLSEKTPASHIPPRTSSLENLRPAANTSTTATTPRSPLTSSSTEKPLPPQLNRRFSTTLDPHSPVEPAPPPPAPDPEPPQPFDFHRFLEQLRHRTADPVARFLRSFLNEFGKRQWVVHEQVKIISDFLDFIHNKMAICDVWREVSDLEFDNAKEGMEKLVMNRLYTQTFSPAIAPPPSLLDKRGKRRQNPNMPGRRGQHQEDVERDEILAQKVAIYGWVREEHLDIKPVGESGRKFLSLAVQELLKINNYRAPRDKVICVLNCCKVIFGLLRHANSTQSADDFVPLLIYVVLRANPEHLVSNIQYILRFRNPDKLGGEAGYYLSSLSGAIQFIEGLDRSSLTINDEEFEKNVEEAVRRIAEVKEPISPVVGSTPRGSVSGEGGQGPPQGGASGAGGRSASMSAAAMAADTQERVSAERRRSVDANANANVGSGDEEKAAVAGLLRTIQKPLSTIGRIFGDDSSSQQSQQESTRQLHPVTVDAGPVSTPLPGNTPRTSPRPNSREGSQQQQQQGQDQNQNPPPTNGFPGARYLQPEALEAAESAARQASAETAEAVRIQRAEHENVVGILSAMFPDLDKDIIDDVVRLKDGRVGLAVDACLALSS